MIAGETRAVKSVQRRAPGRIRSADYGKRPVNAIAQSQNVGRRPHVSDVHSRTGCRDFANHQGVAGAISNIIQAATAVSTKNPVNFLRKVFHEGVGAFNMIAAVGHSAHVRKCSIPWAKLPCSRIARAQIGRNRSGTGVRILYRGEVVRGGICGENEHVKDVLLFHVRQ